MKQRLPDKVFTVAAIVYIVLALTILCLALTLVTGCISPHERYMRSRYDDSGRVLNAWYALTKPEHP